MEQILDGLSEATETLFRPIEVRKGKDFLVVKLDAKGTNFICSYRKLRAIEDSEVEKHIAANRPIVNTKDRGAFVQENSSYVPLGIAGWFNRLPERKLLNKRKTAYYEPDEWLVYGTDFNALMIHYAWPHNQVIFTKGSKEHFDNLILRFTQQSERATIHAKYKLDKEVPKLHDLITKVESRCIEKLAPYQLAALQLSLFQEGYGLLMDRGTGKTAIAIRRVQVESILHKKGLVNGKARAMRVLIVCPRQVRLNWQHEFEKFVDVPAGKLTVIRGGKEERLALLIEALREDPDMYFTAVIASYDSVGADPALFSRPQWDLVITDESHRYKSSATNRWKALIEVRERSHRRMPMTGTPVCNSYCDLWTQFEFLAEGMSGFKTLKGFRDFFGRYEDIEAKTAEGMQLQRLVGMSNIPLLQERLVRTTFAISKEDAGLDLPPKVYDEWEITMSKKQRDLYIQLRDHLVAKLEGVNTEDTVSVNHILTQLMRLAQITSGHITWDEEFDPNGELSKGKRTEQIDPGENPKVQAVLTILADDTEPEEKVIIWAVFVQDIQVLQKAITDAGYTCFSYYGATNETDRAQIEHDFNNDPTVKVLIANPRSAAEGLNLLGYNYNENDLEKQLPTYTGLEIFFSRNWSLVDREQAEDRAHRRGTKGSLRIRDLVAPGTIDEEQRLRVIGKRESADAIQDVKGILQRVLRNGAISED